MAILKRFPFESSVKRMTVITQRRSSNHFTVFVKGAPELIAALCDPLTSKFSHYPTNLSQFHKKNQQRIFPIPQKENFWTQMEIGIESYRLIFGLWNVAREITLSFVCCSIELTEWDVYYSSNELWISTETLHDTRLPSSGTGPKGTKSASNMDPHQQNEPRRSGNSMRVDWIAGRPQPVEAGNDSHATYPSRGSN